MCKKYVKLLFLIVVAMVYTGCSEDPFDWSGDSEKTVPVPVDLGVKFYTGSFTATCTIERHKNDLPIIEVGFFYGGNETITYQTADRIKANVNGNVFRSEKGGVYADSYYIGAYITTSRGVETTGPIYVKR